MEEAETRTQSLAWSKMPKSIRSMSIPSGLKLTPVLIEETLALIRDDALALPRYALIGVAPTKHPTQIELQNWVNVNLVDPNMLVTKIRMLSKGYFVFTFEAKEGASEALQ